jgi:iron-regulated transporter 1
MRVVPHHRSSFAGTEYSFISLFNLLNYIAAAMLSGTEDFRWLALGSLGAVGTSTAVYSVWLRRERGHLVHLEKIGLGR